MSGVRHLYLVGFVLLALILTACSGNNPHTTTQTFADALIEEDYATAASYWSAQAGAEMLSPTDQQEIESFLVEFRASLIADHGPLNGAVVQDPEFDTTSDPPTRGTIPIVWQMERADVMTSWFLAEEEDGWRVAWMPFFSGVVVGELTDNGMFVTPTPIPPTPTPQPTSRDLTVGLAELTDNTETSLDAAITLLELDQSQQIDGAGRVFFRDIPLGTYTVQLTIPGRETTETTIEIRGDQPPPDPLELTVGALIASDPATTILHQNVQSTFFGGNDSTYILSNLTEDGLQEYWTREVTYLGGWNDDRTALGMANNSGIGWIDSSGIITWDWQPDETFPRDWSYRPDLGEIAYVINNDVWTITAEATATPARWTEVGIAREVQGWVDPDTLLVITETGRQIVRRDGTMYDITEASPINDDRIRDRMGWVRFLQDGNNLLRPGIAELITAATIPEGIDYIYGWTRDNQYLLIHSAATEESDTSGVLAIRPDGAMEALATDLTLPARGINRSAQRLIATVNGSTMGGNRWVLAWQGEGQEGIYRMDSAEGGSEKISDIIPEGLFLPTPDLVIYTVAEGSDIGTWTVPVMGGEPTQLFSYRADQATTLSDGTILLVANNTLWETDGKSEPVMIGTEGTVTDIPRFFYHLTAEERSATSPTSDIPTVSAPESATNAGISEEEDTAAIEDAIQEILSQEVSVEGLTFELLEISNDGTHVRGRVTAPNTDPGWVYLRRDGDSWESLGIGTLFTPESLEDMGVPEDLWSEE